FGVHIVHSKPLVKSGLDQRALATQALACEAPCAGLEFPCNVHFSFHIFDISRGRAMISISEITELQAKTVALWHTHDISNPYAGLLQPVCHQHTFKYLLWHEEDIARSKDVSDDRIAEVKRAIDGYNQKRNDGIEALDAYLLTELTKQQVTPQAGA